MKRILSLALAFAMLLTCTAFTAASAESSDTLVVLPYMTSENLNPYAGFSIDKVVRTQLFNSLWQYDENVRALPAWRKAGRTARTEPA